MEEAEFEENAERQSATGHLQGSVVFLRFNVSMGSEKAASFGCT